MQDGNSVQNCSYQLVLEKQYQKKWENYKTNLNFSLFVPQQVYFTRIIHFEKKLFDETHKSLLFFF